MRGHGGSTTGSRPWSVELLADDVIAFLDALRLDRVHYVGESIGGITGIALGALAPDRFHSITLVQTPIRLGPAVGDMMKGPYPTWSAALRDLSPGGWITKNMPPEAPRARWEREQWDRCDVEALARLADATATVDVAHYLPNVRVPTLILAPARSPLTSLTDQMLLRTTIPDAQIEIFEGRDHNIYNDEPGRCTQRVRQFHTEIESRP
jgi:3-oxoadipate enol-lactonase